MAKYLIETAMIGSLSLLTAFSYAQEKDKKEKLNIRVEQEIDGKNKVYVKSIDASNLSAKEKEEIIQKFQDSLMTSTKGKSHRIKIEVDDEDHFERRSNTNHNIDSSEPKRIERAETYTFRSDEGGGDKDIVIRGRPKVKVYKRNGDHMEEFDSDDFSREFRWEMDGLKDNLRTIGKDFKMDFRTFDPFDNAASSKTIKSLDAYPNKPNTEILNVKFNAPENGNVNIRVLDVKGDVVAKEEIKDFTGDYIGQLKIGKAVKGTLFVIVSQGEDGAMKRLVLD